MKTDAYYDDLCQRLQRRVDNYRKARPASATSTRGRLGRFTFEEPSRRSRESGTLLARQSKED
jgi:hypothetical protein